MSGQVDICQVSLDKKGNVATSKNAVRKCGLPLSECCNQEHWEVRLKTYHLNEDRGFRPLVTNTEGEQIDRLLPLNSQSESDELVCGPAFLPRDEKLAEVFVMDSFGISYPTEPKRFWPFPGAINRSALIKTHRMGLEYGQEMPGEKETL